MLNRRTGFATVTLTLLLAGCGGGGGGSSPSNPPPAAPSITTQPVSQTVNAGTDVTFTVAATGATSYQWQRNGTAISGATGASYSLSPATSANNGDAYVVVASNAGGNATSSAATLRVTGVAVLAGQIGAGGYADGPIAQARFWGPAALALDAAGNLYVADYNAVRKISTAGVVSTIAGSPRTCGDSGGPGATALLCYPFALATDAAGNVYVGDGGSSVWQIQANGFVQSYGGTYSCVSALVNVDPVLYVGDGCAAATIYKVSGGVSAPFVSVGSGPGGLSADGMQNLYVANATIVQQVAPTGSVSTLAGTSGLTGSSDGQGAAARFGCALHPGGPNFVIGNGAVAIATLPSGTSFVADYCNNTIRQVTAGGAVTTIVGVAGMPPGAVDATTGSSARLWAPAAVVADPAGNLYVADYLNGLIRKVSAAGVVSTYAGLVPHAGYQDGAAAQAAFRYPYGVVADAAGNLYVADSNNYVIRKITPGGTVSTLAGTPSVEGTADGTGSKALFDTPRGIAIDAGGNLYVADSNSGRIRMVTPAGGVTTLAVVVTGATHNTLVHPNAVAIDPSGNLIVGDNFGVYRSSAPGSPVLAAISSTHSIGAVASGPDGTVYFAQNGSPTGILYALAPGGQPTVLVGSGLSDDIGGIVVGGDGNIYVADRGNSEIKQVSKAGAVTVVVGTSDLPIATVPGGLPARVNSPSGMALLTTGSHVSLAVVDAFEHAVLRVDLP